MGQKLMAHTLPAEGACRESVMDVGPDESVLILLKHCREMKQQETRLRVITLLLLLSCLTLFVFTTGVDLRQLKNSGSTEHGHSAEQSLAYSKQERMCLPDNPPKDSQRLHIHLRSVPTDSKNDKQYLKWHVMFGENYNQENRAIVIPKTGIYFIYVRIALNCHGEGSASNFKRFYVELHNWNKGYNQTVSLTETSDGAACSLEGSRSLFMGELFDLLEGDHVRVWIEEGYKLITKATLGAYLI